MIGLRLQFLVGRYHATPWGRHVNEAAIAWPPEPVRILRALIACHHRKADKARFSDDSLAELIDLLAEALPIYRLPEAVSAQTRHYMPAPIEPTLVFDAFARFDAQEPIVVGWPGISLNPALQAHLGHLAARLGYLGRAESWVEAGVLEWSGEDADAKPYPPDSAGNPQAPDAHLDLVSLQASLSAEDYRERRERLIRDERERRSANWTKKRPPTDTQPEKDMRRFLATLPERLASALALDTSELQEIGWSEPPACRRVLYAVPKLGSVRRGPRRHSMRVQPDPTVARFVLAGRPRPRIEETVRIAELMRRAALAQFGWTKDGASGRWRANAPPVLSGRGPDNLPLKHPDHRHAFWLPEDADDDGEIDHIVVYARDGFDLETRNKLDRLTKLWVQSREAEEEAEERPASGSHQEWRLALEGFGWPRDFRDASRLLGRSQTWQSATPFLAARYLKADGYSAEIERLLKHRGLPVPTVDFLRPLASGISAAPDPYAKDVGVIVKGRLRRAVHFHRFRSRAGERQPDTIGTFLQLGFPECIEGPLALGFACHFGLGLFRACPESR